MSLESLFQALFTLSSLLLPVGSIASPAYDVAGQLVVLTQCAAWLGRGSVTFVLSWLAAAVAHRMAFASNQGLKAALATCLLLTVAGAVRFYVPLLKMLKRMRIRHV